MDKTYIKALGIVAESGNASIKELHERLNIGYPKCMEIIGWMNAEGYITEYSENGETKFKIAVQEIAEAYNELCDSEVTVAAKQLYLLGICFYNGTDVEKNIPAALSCFQSAAKKGYTKAQFMLGLIYQSEEYSGESENLEKSAEYLEQAAASGSRKAQSRLAYCYSEGIGLKKDKEKSQYLEKKSKLAGGKQFNIEVINGKIIDDDLLF